MMNKDSIDTICRGMMDLEERLIRNKEVRSYRETAEQLFRDKVTWLNDNGHPGLSAHYGGWLSIYKRLYPLPRREEER